MLLYSKKNDRGFNDRGIWYNMQILYQFLQERERVKIKYLKSHSSNTMHAFFLWEPVISPRAFSFLNFFEVPYSVFPSVHNKFPVVKTVQ